MRLCDKKLISFGAVAVLALFLCLLVCTAVGTLAGFRAGMLCFWAVLALGVIWLSLVVQPDVPQLVACIALLVGLAYLLVITPLSVPDEMLHYHTSYELSNYLLLRFDDLTLGGAYAFDYTGIVSHSNVSTGYLRLMRELWAPAAPTEPVPIPAPRDISYFLRYLPQALGIALGRLVRGNFVQVFLLGRLCNLLFYAVAVFFAIRRAPCFRLVLGVVALLPMSLQQAASYSYDVFINAVALYLVASALKCIFEPGQLTVRDYLGFLVPAVLLAPAKLIYLPMLLLFLLVPRARFGSLRRQLVWTALLVLACLVFFLLFSMNLGLGRALDPVSEANWEGQQNYRLSFVLQHPLRTLGIFWNSLREMGVWYFTTAIGRQLSGLSLPVPQWIVVGFVGLLLAGVYQRDEKRSLPIAVRAGFAATAAFVLLATLLSLMLIWTSDTSTVVQGVQGRYFIPVLPLCFMALHCRRLALPRWAQRCILPAAVLLHGAVLSCVLSYTLAH